MERGVDLSDDDDFLNVDEYLSSSQKMIIDDYKSDNKKNIKIL